MITDNDPREFSWARIAPLMLVVFAAALTFAPCLKHDFTNWDDPLIVKNPVLMDASLSAIAGIFRDTRDRVYTPLVTLTYWLQARLSGVDAMSFHAGSLLLHLLNIGLVYALILRLTGHGRVAFLTSMFFAVHPMQAEVVAWVSARKDLLCTFFSLGSLIAYTTYLKNPTGKGRRVSFMFFLLALLCKPIAVILPLNLILLDLWYGRHSSKQLFANKIGFFMVAAIHGIASVSFFSFYTPPWMMARVNIPALAVRMAGALAFYTEKLVWPAGFSALYPMDVALGGLGAAVFVALVGWRLMTVSGAGNSRLRVGVMAGFFLVNIMPALPLTFFTGLYAVADRYAYLASVGIFWIMADLMESIFRSEFLVKYAALAILLWTLIGMQATAYAVMAREHAGVWRDSVSLWSDVIRQYPGKSATAYVNLGAAYGQHGDYDEAIKWHTEALAIDPHFAYAYRNRGAAFLWKGECGRALADLNKAIELQPDYAEAYACRAAIQAKCGMVEASSGRIR